MKRVGSAEHIRGGRKSVHSNLDRICLEGYSLESSLYFTHGSHKEALLQTYLFSPLYFLKLLNTVVLINCLMNSKLCKTSKNK